MNTIKQKMIAFLLENANPSIKKRIQSEILNNLTPAEDNAYQTQILTEPNIKLCFASQLDNGWFGHGFHGTNKEAGQFENMETCTKYLGEKAIKKDTPELKRAMNAFSNIPLDDLCYRTKGIYYDEFKYAANGQNLIRCACIARTGYDDIIDITPQINLSVNSFKRVLETNSILDVSRPRKGKPCKSNPSGIYYVFNDYEKWPCRYHLDILAHTSSWKNSENVKIISEAVAKMMKTDQPELIGLTANSWVGHCLGTLGCFPSQGLAVKSSLLLPSPISDTKNNSPKYYNLEYIEWFARCGIIPYVPKLQAAVDEIINSIDENGICNLAIQDDAFKGWGPYGGMQLETDWKKNIRRQCDITFRALLILHYAEQTI